MKRDPVDRNILNLLKGSKKGNLTIRMWISLFNNYRIDRLIKSLNSLIKKGEVRVGYQMVLTDKGWRTRT